MGWQTIDHPTKITFHMSFLHHLISEELIHALGWTVLHSLWQAMAIGLALALLNLGLQRQAASLRYLAGNLALLLVLLVSVLTFVDLYRPAGGSPRAATYFFVAAAGGAGEVAAGGAGFPELFMEQARQYFNRHLPLIVSVWLLGAGVFALRLLGGLAYLQHLRYQGAFPVSAHWRRRLASLRLQLGISAPVRLLESTLVQVPVVIGHFKPVILLPVGALNALPPEQVEAILAHELAHIARRDYLLNILQSLVEVLFYFNPAVWWISAHIRTEREHCCDDIAVTMQGDSLSYARALLSLQERWQPTPALAMALAGNRRRLLGRIQRLLHQPSRQPRVAGRLFATAAMLVGLTLLSMTAGPAADGRVEVLPMPLMEVAAVRPVCVAPPALLPAAVDTLPQEPTSLEVVKGNGERMNVRIDKGKITSLEVDGQPVPAAEYEKYESIVEEYLAGPQLPAPPVPPAPPAPPSPGVLPPPPPAPAPQPPKWDDEGIEWIEKRIDENGRRRIIIERKNGDHIRIEPGEEGAFFFRGDLMPEAIFPGAFEFHDGELSFSGQEEMLEKLHLQLEGLEDQLGILQDEHRLRLHELNDSLVLLFEGLPREALKDLHFVLPEIEAELSRLPDEIREQFIWTEDGHWQGRDFEGTDSFSVTGGQAFINNEIRERLETELLRDGLIDDARHYELELSKGKLTVNGRRQPAATARKYRALYEEIAGIRLSEETEFHIKRDLR